MPDRVPPPLTVQPGRNSLPVVTRRVRLTIQYDGTGFHGWQMQPAVRTVQREVESVVSRLTDRPTRVVAAGRTDTGVHATGQVVSLDVPGKWTAAALRRAMNALLPDDVWVAGAAEAAPDFHARYDALARTYEYRIGTVEEAFSPFHRRVCWPLRHEVDRLLLDRCAEAIVGDHSFRAFAKAGQEERGDRCEVYAAKWWEWPPVGLAFRIRADRYLHHMVRYLVGTSVDVARGRRPFDELPGLLEGREGLITSPPAPPEGLFLMKVEYPDP